MHMLTSNIDYFQSTFRGQEDLPTPRGLGCPIIKTKYTYLVLAQSKTTNERYLPDIICLLKDVLLTISASAVTQHNLLIVEDCENESGLDPSRRRMITDLGDPLPP